METGFLKHDSEYFITSDSNEFEPDSSLFPLVNDYDTEFDDYQWAIADNENHDTNLNVPSETAVHRDDLNKTFRDWELHVSNLTPCEDDLNISSLFLHDDKLADIFPQCSPRQLSSLQHTSFLDDPLNPDHILDELDSPTCPPILPELKEREAPQDQLEAAEDELPSTDFLDFDLPPTEHYLTDNTKCPDQVDHVDVSCVKMEKIDDSYAQTEPIDISRVKIEKIDEDVEVDVETVCDSIPVIQAHDIDSVLGQTEAFVRETHKSKLAVVKPSKRTQPEQLKVPPLIIKKMNSQLKVQSAPSTPKPPHITASDTSNKTAPPTEIIERIKKSSKKKKAVTVVPAERLPVKGTSLASNAKADKIKVRDVIAKKKIKTETPQIDHNYCSNDGAKSSQDTSKETAGGRLNVAICKPPVPVLIDAFCVTEEDKWVLDNEQKLLMSVPTASPSHSEASSNTRMGNNWEKNSKRDSGLESGEVSDASECPSDKKCHGKSQMTTVENSDSVQVKVEEDDDWREVAQVSHDITLPTVEVTDESANEREKNEPKKKKLNLDEYRNRRKFARLGSPIKTGTLGEAIMSSKWVQRSPKESTEPTPTAPPVEEKNTRISNVEIRVEASPKKVDDDKRRRRSRSSERSRSRYRHRSSSSSSTEHHVRSSRVRERSRTRNKYTRHSHRSRSRDKSSRYRSRSRSSSYHSRSSSSRSRSGSGSRSRSSRSSRYRARSRSRSRSDYRRSSNRRYSRSRFSSDKVPRRSDDWPNRERLSQVEERRVIYVGQIEEGTTKAQLRERFQCFGPIVDISLHFREVGDNYGFVTFVHKCDAYKAVEHGNDNPMERRYEICFGGRRAFCKQRYADLDSTGPQTQYSPYHQAMLNDSFDNLLQVAREKLLREQKNV